MTGATPSQLAMSSVLNDLALYEWFDKSCITLRSGAVIFVRLPWQLEDVRGLNGHILPSIEQILLEDLYQQRSKSLLNLNGTEPCFVILDDPLRDFGNSTVATAKLFPAKQLPSRLITALLSRIITTNP